ncbi:MAG: hypothetical protein ICV83_18180 [Cytophagales bacterium]|nr:hypothetical protein [Cytophagales bacterium]
MKMVLNIFVSSRLFNFERESLRILGYQPGTAMLTRNEATVADYRKLPEGAKYELIGGEIIERENPSMPGSKIKHQALSTRLVIALGKRNHRTGERVAAARPYRCVLQ